MVKENKIMNIETFIAQMNGDHKESVIQKHITRQYVPLEEKIAEAEKIIELACYKEIVDANGNKQKIYWINTPKQCFLSFLASIKMYTDLVISESDPLNDYNKLAEKKYDQKILELLPDDNCDFLKILDMMCEDENENVNSIEGRIKNFIFGFDGVLQQALIQMIDNTTEDNNGEQQVENRMDIKN